MDIFYWKNELNFVFDQKMVCVSDNFGNYAFNTMGILYDFIYEQMWWLHQELFIRPFFSPKVYMYC